MHEMVPADQLDAACGGIIDALLKGAPGAQAAAKTLIRDAQQAAAGNAALPRWTWRRGWHDCACRRRPRKDLRIFCQAQGKLAPGLGRSQKTGWASLPVPCPNPLAILEDGVRGLSTW